MPDKVIVDEALRAKLKDLREPLELCDEAGRTVGHFLPDVAYQHLIYAMFKLKYPLEELQRRQAEAGGRTTAEILADLRRV